MEKPTIYAVEFSHTLDPLIPEVDFQRSYYPTSQEEHSGECSARTPSRGHLLCQRIRQRIVQSQRVIYAIDDERQIINILAIVHVRQDLQAMTNKPWE